MKGLKEIVGGRTVGLMLHGSSIAELENRIEKFKDYDICWVATNYFRLVEKNILEKIGKKLDIVAIYAGDPLVRRKEDVKEFLKRGNNLFICNPPNSNDIKELSDAKEELRGLGNILYDIGLTYPNSHIFPFTFLQLLRLLWKQTKRVILFGADGIAGKKDNDYYKNEQFKGIRNKSSIRNDTAEFNTRGISWKIPETINCCLHTCLKHFKTISYDGVEEYF